VPLEKARQILDNIRKGDVRSVYFLTGDEPFYIDGISNYIEENLLAEEEKEFNQIIYYGRDIKVEDIISTAKRYPMMAERQLVIIKEAQDLSRTIEDLLPYVENPQPTTVLVLCYKYKKLDKRKKLSKEIIKSGVFFESKKLYENQVPDWIREVVTKRGYSITPKAAQMLVEFIGNDLSKVNNELEKLQLIIKPGESITPILVEENIGISKDYNNFELQNAISRRDVKKAFGIIQYFGNNPKNHPLVMTTALMFNFFSKVMKYHSLINKSHAPKVLGVSPFFIKDYELAAQNYPMKKVSGIISSIRDMDMKSKGVGAAKMSQADLLKEVLVTIFS
jgi:DNA polymerase-3 subunit delta